MNKSRGLKIDNLFFKFEKDADFFFNGISLEASQGQINFICGPNGSGKSTLFRILQGRINKNEVALGKCVLNGKEYNFDSVVKRKELLGHVKLVKQKFDIMLADEFSFKQNLRFSNFLERPALISGSKSFKLPDFLSAFGIDINKQVMYLSGGQRQILAILMVLQKPTTVLLLDEPTAALDEENAILVMNFLDNLVKTTDLIVLIISHDKDLVKKYLKNGYFGLRINQETKGCDVVFLSTN